MSSNTTNTDVLILGAGPAGLMLASQLSLLSIPFKIIDKSATRVELGHADGFQCRTVEVFKALGISGRVVEEGNEVSEVVFWNPDPEEPEKGLVETRRIADTAPGTSYFRHVLLGQGRVEQFLMDSMKKSSGQEVQRLTTPSALSLAPSLRSLLPTTAFPTITTIELQADVDEHPIAVSLTKLLPPAVEDGNQGKSGLYRSNMEFADAKTNGSTKSNVNASVVPDGNEETVRCKYIIGCDGARSWLRKMVGLELKGDSSNSYWGVVDALADTNLPTIRMKNTIHSASSGSILTVPRERGYTRFYVQMGTLEPGQRIDRSEVTVDKILAKAKKILYPYKLETPDIEWFTCYEIGQRLCDTFSIGNRIFIAGDACHTHSPKAGQGMNVSMMDSFNMGWKLGAVIKGLAKPAILDTYQSERHSIANDLINWDSKLSKAFSGKPTVIPSGKAGGDEVTPEEFEEMFQSAGKWTSGTATTYIPSIIVGPQSGTYSSLAKHIKIGSHFENYQVVCNANAQAVQLQHCLKADGRWRIIIFAGDILQLSSLDSLRSFCEALDGTTGPLKKYTPFGQDVDSAIQVITVLSTPRSKTDVRDLPEVLRPRVGKYKLQAFDTIFNDDSTYHDGHGHAYEKYGIGVEGCVVVVRPDQYVSGVYELGEEGVSGIERFFEGCLIAQV